MYASILNAHPSHLKIRSTEQIPGCAFTGRDSIRRAAISKSQRNGKVTRKCRARPLDITGSSKNERAERLLPVERVNIEGGWWTGHRIALLTATSFATVTAWGASAALVLALGFSGSNSIDAEPVEPFTVYGTLFKKLVIEVLDDEGHIIKRKRGVTATACVSSVAASQETPQFQGLPTGMKVTAFGDEVCRRGEADDMPQAVAPACRAACTISVTDYSKKQFDFSGYKLPEKDEQRMMKSCVRECNMSGTRPGKSFQFVVPYRR
mmetsp:Transcript_27468/g.52300  ORF Transcript_27468/g.52300 Transcript_27468/m.52300 type:complete len:265 (-) Transcript_27468:211-1005(-)